ncbi:MAG: hypothetical protein RLZZ528_2797 [Pseudomonadota bacterium]
MRVGLVRLAVLLGLVAGLAGCGRNAVPLTECAGGKPVIERIEDVAPPSCDPVLPGVLPEGA